MALGEPATLVLLGEDYDGGKKAWVRWADGIDDIVPGLAGLSATAVRPLGAQAAPQPQAGCRNMQGMARESEKIPTSRVRRTATVGKLAASEAVKQFGTRAANMTRGEEASRRRWPGASWRPPSRSSRRSGR